MVKTCFAIHSYLYKNYEQSFDFNCRLVAAVVYMVFMVAILLDVLALLGMIYYSPLMIFLGFLEVFLVFLTCYCWNPWRLFLINVALLSTGLFWDEQKCSCDLVLCRLGMVYRILDLGCLDSNMNSKTHIM